MFQDQGITAYSNHPGWVATEMTRHNTLVERVVFGALAALVAKTPKEGSQTSLFCALSPRAQPGCYHLECAPFPPQRLGYDQAQCDALWEYSLRSTGVDPASLSA